MSSITQFLSSQPYGFIYIYWLAISLVLFLVMGFDKSAARNHRRRVPEKTLFLLAAIGGAFGGIIGMLAFRHKTKHTSFVVGFPLILIVQLALYFYLT